MPKPRLIRGNTDIPDLRFTGMREILNVWSHVIPRQALVKNAGILISIL